MEKYNFSIIKSLKRFSGAQFYFFRPFLSFAYSFFFVRRRQRRLFWFFFFFLRVYDCTKFTCQNHRPHTIFECTILAAHSHTVGKHFSLILCTFRPVFPKISLPATRPNSTRSFQNGGLRTRRILGFSTAEMTLCRDARLSMTRCRAVRAPHNCERRTDLTHTWAIRWRQICHETCLELHKIYCGNSIIQRHHLHT